MPVFEARSPMPVSAGALFGWHERPGAFQRLVPPWERIRVVEQQGGIRDGARLIMDIGAPPLRIRWVARHRDYIAGVQFRDEQERGPFSRWVHTHRIEPGADGGSVLEDVVDYRLPLGWPAELIAGSTVRRMLDRMFAHRHDRTRQDLARHAKYPHAGALRIALSGASGLIGSQLGAFLQTGGHTVTPMVRKRPADPRNGIYWNAMSGEVDLAALEGVDAVIHLAGENVAGGRWTDARKKAVLESRVRGTKTIVDAILALDKPPPVLVAASAIGYYGARGDEPLVEDSPAGTGFLADVCKAWEEAAKPAADAGIRVVNVRIGIVLSAQGGALGAMLTPFKLGLGGVVGSGQQPMSWIALDDVIGLFHHALLDESVTGPLNATAPSPVTNATFTKTLGRVLRRPTIVPVPSFAIRAMFGEMGDTLLLQGARVLPAKAESTGFAFLHRDLESALRAELGR